MDNELERYINDHLAASCGALDLISELADRQEEAGNKEFYVNLERIVTKDQSLLRSILDTAGMSESKGLQLIGTITEKAGRAKLLWEGLGPGRLGMFEALEILALGIQGKRLLWVMLAEIATDFPEWEDFDFAELELEAIRQRDEVEERRVDAGRDSFRKVKPGLQFIPA